MFSVYVRSELDPRDADMVKLTLVFHRTGYDRVRKLLLITGPYSEWDKKSRSFKPDTVDNVAKNKLLQQERIKYLKVAEKWEYSGSDWTPLELARYYDTDNYSFKRNSTVSQIFDLQIQEYSDRKRYRNGKLFTGQRSAESIRFIKNHTKDLLSPATVRTSPAIGLKISTAASYTTLCTMNSNEDRRMVTGAMSILN